MKEISLIFLVLGLSFLSTISLSQNFEGSITYKLEAQNPNPEMISDSMWQAGMKEQFGERGHMLQKTFYKGPHYFTEIDAGKSNGFMAFNPEDGLIYSWQENADAAVSIDSRKSMDAFESITALEETKTILDIICQGVRIKSKLGEMTLWYNPAHFEMDPKYYKGHLYGHWEQTLAEISCIPLMIEQQGFMGMVKLTATSYKEEPLDDEKFKLPKFKEVAPNPMN